MKYAPQGGLLRVAVGREPGQLRVGIANSGQEIPREKRELIFRKFYQTDPSRSSVGNGIGLAIVQRVVQLHSGRVEVECEGGITTFTVTLPHEIKEGTE